MYYTTWEVASSSSADPGFSTLLSYGLTQTIDAFTFTSNDFEETYRVKLVWPGSTSTTLQTATRYTEATQKYTERDSDGNVTNVVNLNGDSNTTQNAPFGGGMTINTSYGVTYRPTENVTFRVTYTTIGSGTGTTVLSATTLATRESAGTTSTNGSGLTTVSQFATGRSKLMFSNVKENAQFGNAGEVNRFYSAFGRTAGEGPQVIGRRVAAAFSASYSPGAQAFQHSAVEDASVEAFLAASLTTTAGVAGTNAPVTVSFARKYLSTTATSDVFYLSTGTDSSFYTTFSLNDSNLTDIPSFFVPMFQQHIAVMNRPGNVNTNGGEKILTPRLFTDAENGFSIGSSSATARWAYQSSSWILYTTKANATTRTSGSAGYSFSGSAQTATQNHANVFTASGDTQFHFGPAIPLTVSGLNEISLTSVAPFTSDVFYLRTQLCTTGFDSVTATSRTGTFATLVSQFTGSTSSSVAIGSATGPRMVATYPHTVMSAAVAVPGMSISTRNVPTALLFDYATVGVAKGGKWNEAGQANQVSVRFLPAARTAFA